MHKTTLEQWALLERVIEAGSFAKAAEETHRSQSSVSYNLSLLQERLGVALLMTEGRRAVLTPAGELLLNQVKPLLLPGSEFTESDPEEIKDRLEKVVELIIHGGYLGQQPTTVVDLTEDAPEVIREGVGDVKPFL